MRTMIECTQNSFLTTSLCIENRRGYGVVVDDFYTQRNQIFTRSWWCIAKRQNQRSSGPKSTLFDLFVLLKKNTKMILREWGDYGRTMGHLLNHGKQKSKQAMLQLSQHYDEKNDENTRLSRRWRPLYSTVHRKTLLLLLWGWIQHSMSCAISH